MFFQKHTQTSGVLRRTLLCCLNGRLFIALTFCLVLLASGCAKLPSATAPVGKGSASGAAISKTALANIGVPYRAGGNHPSKGFDCSGLVCWTYAQHGITMPRTSREQAGAGKAIGKSQLQAGDVVVFKISNRRGYHSGIYTGNGMFVHSPRRGDTVREDDMNSKYWAPKLVATRRVASSK